MAFSNSLGAQGVLKGAEYFWNSDPGEGNAQSMPAADGQFDGALETAIKQALATPPGAGLNVFAVRFQDSTGYWGPVFRRTVYVEDSVRAIKINLAECFWDNDPGEGAGLTMLAFDGAFNSAVETILKNSLSVPSSGGLHVFNIRVKDEASNWGPVFKRTIAIEDSPRLIQLSTAEYFWDNDPGEGSASVMLAFDGAFDNALETVLKSNLNVPSSGGLHLFNVRIRDENSNWGPLFSRTIAIEDGPRDIKVSSAEYFWGQDPGEGSGTAMIAFDGAFNTALETVLKSGVSTASLKGLQVFSVRIRDENSNWGPVFRRTIAVEDDVRDIKITSAEFFWDNDPGEGAGTALVAFDGAFSSAIETVLKSSLSAPASGGIHSFNVRIQDENLNWGPVFKRSISLEDAPRSIKVTAAEYFWGLSDPGDGNGITMLAFDGAFSEALEIAMASPQAPPSSGLNLFNLRIKDSDNQWGPLFKRTIYVSYGGGPITWTGAYDEDWHKACNWSPETVPDCNHPVYIPLTANNPRITGVANCNIVNIETDNGARLYIETDSGAKLNIDECGFTKTEHVCP